MNWDELRARASQEAWKRLDLALYRIGGERATRKLRSRPGALPNFFFGAGEAAHRAALWRTHLPREADAVIHEADKICRHEFHLLGYENLFYGPDIDWHFDAVHRKRSPIKPWFKINFLDFRSVGDHKVIWELNRHQHLVTLAKAWLLTRKAVYASEIVNQWNSWQAANPHPLGINWASSLEVAFRSLSWLWVRSLLAGCEALPVNFQTDLVLALQLHGRYIDRYLSTYFSPNTHLLGEAVALFSIGTLCPEISAAESWRNKGWDIILRESERQVRPDGVYFEQALYYHVYALDFFLHARMLASKSGVAIPQRFDNVLQKMLDVVHALSEGGPIEGFGDDDGGRVFDARRNRVECMTDPLAIGAILYGREKYATAKLTGESIWLFGDEAIGTLEKPHSGRDAASKTFLSGGVYLINDAEPCAQQLMIDGGPQGAGRSGHGHADALSIRFSIGGQRILVDPGTCCYVSGSDDERAWFRGTGAHNTLKVDNLDQALPEGPFAWSSIPNVTVETWVNGQTFDFFAGSHDGYRRLRQPVLHSRFVFHVKGGFWLVRDVAEGESSHLLESFWHFPPELEVRKEQDTVLARSSPNNGGRGSACAALLVDRNSVWTTEVVEGFFSAAYGSKQVAPVLRISANAKLPQECAVLLLPGLLASATGTFAALGEGTAQNVRGYRYQTLQATELLFFAEGNDAWTCGAWTSDSKFLYCRVEQGRLTHVIMVLGSHAEWRGKRFVSQPSRTEAFEWMSARGSQKAFSSEGDVPGELVAADFEIVDSA